MTINQFKVIDNFLEDKDFKSIKQEFESEKFPWYFGNYKVKNSNNLRLENKREDIKNEEDHFKLVDDYNFQFVHPFYKKSIPSSEYINVLKPIFDKIHMDVILRIKANLTLKTEKLIEYDFHNDTKVENATTAVYYLNTNNGYTLFKNKQKVYSVENRIVFFDAKEVHCGTSCTDKENRIVLNINYIST